MAFATGTATGHSDLFTKLVAFLKTNAALVAAGQNWQTAWQDSDSQDVVLRGPGLSSTDTVYVGLSPFANPTADSYGISIYGMTGVVPSGNTATEHINVSPQTRIFTDSAPMDYWFVANGRRFIVVLKISTIFEAAYAGLFLPYATPLSYPYPMFVGGSAGTVGMNGTVPNWRSQAANHRHFISPQQADGNGFITPGAYMLDPAGQWLSVAQATVGLPGQVGIAPEWAFDAFGAYYGIPNKFGPEQIRIRMMPAYGDDYPLVPCTLVQALPTDQTWGILDGAFRVAGFANSSENIVTVGGVDHLVVQNVYRTTTGDYWALALE